MANRHLDRSVSLKDKNRSEQVRARREQTSKKPIKAPQTPPRSNVTRKPSDQRVPVTRRVGTPVPAVTRRKNATYVPLRKKGAELQLPTFPRIQLGWRLISGAIFMLSLTVIISFSSLSNFQISTIQLRGAQRLSSEVLLDQVDIVGKSIIRLDPESIKTTIEDRFSSLSAVHVTVSLPANVTIRVVERTPLILWQMDNTSLWIDSEGVLFPVIGEAEIIQTVNATGDPPAPPKIFTPEVDDETGQVSILLEESIPRTTEDFVQAVLSISEYIPQDSDLLYNPQFGLGWQDPNGWMVYFGRDTVSIDMKLAEYQTIINALARENITPAIISLEFLHAPFIRLEQ